MTMDNAIFMAGGFVFGLMCSMACQMLVKRAKSRRDAFDAPVPVDLGYDVNNPVNGGLNVKHGECVMMGGKRMWRM